MHTKTPLDRVAAKDSNSRRLAAVLGVLVVGALDYATRPDMAFAVFYLIPIAATAWYVGRGSGLAVAALGSLSWLLGEALSSPPTTIPILLWNGFSRLLIFAALVLLLVRLQEERAALARANHQLGQRNQDLDAFAGRVAHDLRNAMAPVSLVAPLLRLSAADPQKISLLADRLDASCRKSMLIIDSLLALAKAQPPPAEMGATRLLPAVNAVMGDLDEEVTRNAIEVCIRVDPELTVRCDAGLLHVLLANLVGNAVKYLSDHPQPRTLDVSACARSHCVDILVADNGPGIPVDEQARIFEPFYRGRLAGAPGTGIGLATVERIVRSQGGTVTLQSDGSGGASFRVSLAAAGVAPE